MKTTRAGLRVPKLFRVHEPYILTLSAISSASTSNSFFCHLLRQIWLFDCCVRLCMNNWATNPANCLSCKANTTVICLAGSSLYLVATWMAHMVIKQSRVGRGVNSSFYFSGLSVCMCVIPFVWLAQVYIKWQHEWLKWQLNSHMFWQVLAHLSVCLYVCLSFLLAQVYIEWQYKWLTW